MKLPRWVIASLLVCSLLGVSAIATVVAIKVSADNSVLEASRTACLSRVQDRDDLRGVLLDVRKSLTTADGMKFADALLVDRPPLRCVRHDGIYITKELP